MRYYPGSGRLMRQDAETGRWYFAPGTAKHTFDSRSGREAALSKWEQIQEAGMAGLMEAIGKHNPPEAIKELNKRVTELALSGERGRAPYLTHARELAGLTTSGESVSPHEGGFRLTLEGSLTDFRKALAKEYAGGPDISPPTVIDVEPEPEPEQEPTTIVNLDGLPTRQG